MRCTWNTFTKDGDSSSVVIRLFRAEFLLNDQVSVPVNVRMCRESENLRSTCTTLSCNPTGYVGAEEVARDVGALRRRDQGTSNR